jgi:hypothetical protein
MELNEIEYKKFVKWLNEKNHPGFTLSQVEFAKQIFEFLTDYPSFENKIKKLGSKSQVFFEIEQYLKQK